MKISLSIQKLYTATFLFLLLMAKVCNGLQADDATATAASQAQEPSAEQPERKGIPAEDELLLLRNTPDGTVEVWSGDALINAYPPGSLPFTGPSQEALTRLQLQKEAVRTQEEELQDQEELRNLEEKRLADQKQSEQEQLALESQEKALEQERLQQSAVSVLNGETGEYVELVPLGALERPRPKNEGRSTRSSQPSGRRSVSVLNRMTGTYVQGVPLKELVAK